MLLIEQIGRTLMLDYLFKWSEMLLRNLTFIRFIIHIKQGWMERTCRRYKILPYDAFQNISTIYYVIIPVCISALWKMLQTELRDFCINVMTCKIK